jgi:hypothetical protein
MRTSTILLAVLAATASCVIVADDSRLTIRNRSSHLLTAIRVTGVGDQTWGPNLLDHSLYPGQSFSIDVGCGWYDVMVSNERNVDCVLSGLHLCFGDDVWRIDDATLDACAWN